MKLKEDDPHWNVQQDLLISFLSHVLQAKYTALQLQAFFLKLKKSSEQMYYVNGWGKVH